MNLNNDIEIRNVGTADAGLLSSVAIRAYADHYLHLWFDGGQWYIEKSFSVEQLVKELGNPASRFYLVYDRSVPIGFIKLNSDAPFRDDQPALELERIYLVREATGRSIGKKLLEFIMQTARDEQKRVVWLKAMDSSVDAIRFYGQMGFSISGTSRLEFDKMKPEFRGMVIMEKEL